MLDLHEALQGNGAAALSQAIRGLGGIGKTQTAVEYAYRYGQGEDAVYNWVFWVRAETELSLAQDFGEIAVQVGVATQAKNTEERVQTAKRWLNANGGWLLVFDNADDPSFLKGYRPNNASGRVLLTSRAQSFGGVGIAKALALESLAPPDAVQFLWTRVGREQPGDVDDETRAAEELTETLGGLPLALEQAGAYVAQMETRFRTYLLSYRRRELKLLEKQLPETGDYLASVATTWQLNFEQVEQQSVAAVRVLELSAFVASDAIPYELLALGREALGTEITAALDGVEEEPLLLDELLAPLAQFSLVMLESEKYCYGIHRMVRAVVLDGLTAEERQAWVERTVAGLNATFPEVKFENWWRCRRLVKHGEALLKHQPVESEAWALLLHQVGTYFHHQAEYERSLICLSKSLEIYEAKLSPTHLDTAKSLNNLAFLYKSMGRYKEAELLYVRSLEIIETQLGPKHPDTATSLNNLASLCQSMGHSGKAEPLYVRSLEIREVQLGNRHPDTATSLNNLALLYESMGRYEEAEPLHIRSLEIREAKLGPKHPDTAVSLNNLALLYESMGHHEEAETLYARALEIREAKLGPKHPDTATSLSNLAGLYRSMGRYGEAEPLYARSLEIRVAKLGRDHPSTAKSLNNLALLYRLMGRYGEAEPLYARSLEIRTAKLGLEHPSTAESLNNLALLYQFMGRYGEAEPLYARSLEIRAAKLGLEHPSTAKSLNNLAGLYELMGRDGEAEPLYARSLLIKEQQLGVKHSSTVGGYHNLAMLYLKMKRYGEAEPLLIKVIQVFHETLGEDHLNTLAVFGNFYFLVQQAVQSNRTDELSDHSLTQQLLQQIKAESSTDSEA